MIFFCSYCLASQPKAYNTHLVVLELRTNSPAFVVSKRVSILLEKRVDARDAAIPTVFQVFKSQTSERKQKQLLTFFKCKMGAHLHVGTLYKH